MDRLTLVTGTSRGIGHAVAQELVEHGWDVVGIARHASPIESPRYRHLRIDIADIAAFRDSVERELAATVADGRWERVGVVNNAAISSALGPVERIDPAGMSRMGIVNWVAPTFLMGFFVSRVPADTPLRIVN